MMVHNGNTASAGLDPGGQASGDVRAESPWVSWQSLAFDVFVAVATGTVAVSMLLMAAEPTGSEPDTAAYLLLAFGAVALVWRRRFPAWVLAVASVLTFAYLGLDYAGGPGTVVPLVALYSAAAAGHRGLALLVTGAFAVGGLLFRVLVEGEPVVTVAFTSALYVAVTLHGDAVHSRRALRATSEKRLKAAIAHQEQEMDRRVGEQRLTIARELHDVMAHTITSVAVQTAAASDLFDSDPDESKRILRSVRASVRQAMSELKATVSLLRSGEELQTRAPSPSLRQLDELAHMAEENGIDVESITAGKERPLPAAVQLTIFRVVQEAITNVIRHAAASRVLVEIEYRLGGVTVRVADDGVGAEAPGESGFGLVGMKERVEAMGGRLATGASPLGGFEIAAVLPIREE